MKTLLTLISLAGAFAVPVLLTACSSDPNDKLLGPEEQNLSHDSRSVAGGSGNTYNHDFSNPSSEQGITGADPVPASGPVPAAAYHGCTKITYAALGSILN